MNTVNTGKRRATYRHGDLRRALIGIGVELAAEGGPHAVVLREAARRADVSASAAYRHFANQQELLDAVRGEVLDLLAESMGSAVDGLPRPASAQERLTAAGRAYFGFAVHRRTHFACLIDAVPLGSAATSTSRDDPLNLLGALVEAARDEADRTGPGPSQGRTMSRVRESARAPGDDHMGPIDAVDPDLVALWAPIHGAAVLCSVGALSRLPEDERTACFEATLTNALRGFLDAQT